MLTATAIFQNKKRFTPKTFSSLLPDLIPYKHYYRGKNKSRYYDWRYYAKGRGGETEARGVQ